MGYKSGGPIREKTTYNYTVLPDKDVREYFEYTATPHKDACISEDLASIVDELKAILAAGYQWVRSEGGYAIFEQETIEVSPSVM